MIDNTMKSKKIIAAIVFFIVVLIALAFPISNLFLKRQIEEPLGGLSEFKPVSNVLQTKCADCHIKDKTVYPFYKDFPLAKSIVDDDIRLAQENIVFSREKLLGLTEFSRLELSKIHTVIDSGAMPPPQYRILHWDSTLSDSERKAFIDWIKAESKSRQK